jgi:hypothetical protein
VGGKGELLPKLPIRLVAAGRQDRVGEARNQDGGVV